MIGRTDELAWLKKALAVDKARVQILGPAGVGKSTLAAACMGHVTWFSLETVAPGALRSHLATGLGSLANPDAVRAALGQIEGLVLDGTETHTSELATLLDEWATVRTPILLTSQVRHANVRSLEIGTLPHDQAVALFMARCATQSGQPEAQDANLDALIRKLDGWPLAIELAASRLRLYSPGEMLEEDVFEVLRDHQRPGRHGSIHRALQASWTHLGPDAQAALARVALIAGRFDRLAFTTLTEQKLTVLERLMDASLVVWGKDNGRRHYRLLNVVRTFALRQLAADDAARDRYASFILDAAEEAVTKVLGLERLHAYQTLGALATDLEALLESKPEYAARAAIALAVYAYDQGSIDRALTHVRSAPGDACREMEANLLIRLGRLEEAGALLDSLPTTAHRLNLQGQCLRDSDPTAGIARFEQAAKAPDASPYDRAVTALSRGVALRRLGFILKAETAYEHALELSREHSLVSTEIAALANLTLIERDLRGATPKLHRMAKHTLDLSNVHGVQRRVCHLLVVIAQWALDTGHPDTLGYLQAAEADARRIGMWTLVQMTTFHRGLHALQEKQLETVTELLDRAAADEPAILSAMQACTLQGYLAWGRGETDEAVRCFETAKSRAEERQLLNKAIYFQLLQDAVTGTPSEPLDSRWPPDSPLATLWQVADRVRQKSPLPTELAKKVENSIPCRLLIDRSLQRVEVAADGRWFRTPAGEVDLGRRRVMRRLLTILATHAGKPVELQTLLDEGWPGEKMTHSSGRARVHVAISELRKQGLRDFLLTAESDTVAYILHATVVPSA